MLSKKDRDILMKKLTGGVSVLLGRANARWTDREISEIARIPAARLTEYKNYGIKEYARPITYNNLLRLIGGGFVTIKDLVKEVEKDLTADERAYLQDLQYFDNVELSRLIVKNNKRGANQIELQKIVSDLLDRGIDPIELLRHAKKSV